MKKIIIFLILLIAIALIIYRPQTMALKYVSVQMTEQGQTLHRELVPVLMSRDRWWHDIAVFGKSCVSPAMPFFSHSREDHKRTPPPPTIPYTRTSLSEIDSLPTNYVSLFQYSRSVLYCIILNAVVSTTLTVVNPTIIFSPFLRSIQY